MNLAECEIRSVLFGLHGRGERVEPYKSAHLSAYLFGLLSVYLLVCQCERVIYHLGLHNYIHINVIVVLFIK